MDLDRIERAARTVETHIKEMGDSKDVEVEYKGLLSRLKKDKSKGKKEKTDIDRVAEYVMQIRKAKEAYLNGGK